MFVLNLSNFTHKQFEQLVALFGGEKQGPSIINYIGNVSKSTKNHISWIFDSGAFDHIVSYATYMKTNREYSSLSIVE